MSGLRADVLVCGASFAGLAVARELAGSGADVLVLDRNEIGGHPTSACAAPTPWLEALGLGASIRQEIPYMRFRTPHGSVRYRLPWTWAAFDYRTLCLLLWEQCDARFVRALVRGRAPGGVRSDRGDVLAPLVVDALGWRRVLARAPNRPPVAPISRGLEIHPDGSDTDLEVIVDRSLVRRGYCWSVPADGERRVGAGSYDPHVAVKAPTLELARRLELPPIRFQGNWFPHRLRPAVEDGVFFVGDSSGQCLPLSGEGIRTAFYFGGACGRELRRVVSGQATREEALRRYADFSAGHARGFALLLTFQRLLPALPPRVLTGLLRLAGRPALVARVFTWYLGLAPPHPVPERPDGPRPSGALQKDRSVL